MSKQSSARGLKPLSVRTIPFSNIWPTDNFSWYNPMREMLVAYMLQTERILLFHDTRKRYASYGFPLVYPIENTEACGECFCYLINPEEDTCLSIPTNAKTATLLRKSSRYMSTMIRSRVPNAAARLFTSLALVLSPSSTMAAVQEHEHGED